ncbi:MULTISPECIES: peptidase [unclassified Bacillus (in: firmicutes)]|uniref:peptidase n=1 Tax=unclassified Bacillus (in: firmicutes) TaxID=185979 RepID=UPI0008DF6BF2|nr:MULTISPECIES: peptidase [unclassified Bacillus (in: firmicutes)]SFI00006.1 4-acetamidobutyryl-CoA deacetylase [Bacillus sp. 71mf]SFS93060.1 4-acetamidobutyryl-CoA deacetylase [Bacillus sp. 103mf]
MEQYKKQVCEYIESHENMSVKLLKRLIQEKSTSGDESGAQAVVIEKLRELGLDLDIWEPSFTKMKDHPYFVSPRTNFTDSPNIVATLKGSGGGKSMILNGHIDVVPEGDVNQWEHHPYAGEQIGNRIYGRGTTDMKGGNVSLMLAIEAIVATGISLKGDVYFQSVIEEESGGAGTLAALLRGYEADGVIIPEPTNMKFFPKQQGSMWFRLFVKGKAAHGGTRYEGVSAIEKSMLVVRHVRKLEEKRNERITDPLYKEISIPIPINIGKIEGGSWPSSVPDFLTLEGRYGVAPNESMEEAKIEFENWIGQLNQVDPWFAKHPVEVEWFGARWVPGELEEKHPLMTTLKGNFVHIEGTEPIIEASPWGTDGGLFTQIANIPTIVFGPGETKVAHYPNEYIEIDKMIAAAKIIACTLLDWCEVDK